MPAPEIWQPDRVNRGPLCAPGPAFPGRPLAARDTRPAIGSRVSRRRTRTANRRLAAGYNHARRPTASPGSSRCSGVTTT